MPPRKYGLQASASTLARDGGVPARCLEPGIDQPAWVRLFGLQPDWKLPPAIQAHHSISLLGSGTAGILPYGRRRLGSSGRAADRGMQHNNTGLTRAGH